MELHFVPFLRIIHAIAIVSFAMDIYDHYFGCSKNAELLPLKSLDKHLNSDLASKS